MANLTEKNKSITLRFAKEGWGTNPNWQQTWDELMSPDVVYYFNSTPDPIVGLDANKAFNESLFRGFRDIHQTIVDMIAEANKVVYRTTIEGTHTGEFFGTPPTGKTIRVNDFTMLEIADGKIVKWWYECNLLAVMQQLGLMVD